MPPGGAIVDCDLLGARQIFNEAARLVTEQTVLDCRFADLTIQQRRPDADEVKWAVSTLATRPKLGEKSSILPRAYAERFLKLTDEAPEIDIPLQAVRIRDVVATGILLKTSVETGLELKEKNPFKPSWTHSIAGGYFGYLPTPQRHEWGGYETWLGTNRLEKEASVKITETLLEMLAAMK